MHEKSIFFNSCTSPILTLIHSQSTCMKKKVLAAIKAFTVLHKII